NRGAVDRSADGEETERRQQRQEVANACCERCDAHASILGVQRRIAAVRELLANKPIFGMIHMPALPGAPANDKSMDELVAFALSEAEKLGGAGLDACIVENVGDVPLFRDHV